MVALNQVAREIGLRTWADVLQLDEDQLQTAIGTYKALHAPHEAKS